MSQRQRSHELRLEIGAEADALLSQLGVEAYRAARRRACEASSDAMAQDWSGVAARSTPSLLDTVQTADRGGDRRVLSSRK